ncbi:MAG: hypothetical protein ACUVS2_07725 [Candidatus Flexifilum sp.]
MALNSRTITIEIDRHKLQQTLFVLPALIVMMSAVILALVDTINRNLAAQTSQQETETVDAAGGQPPLVPAAHSGYPINGSDLDRMQFAVSLPPPPLDAMPYDVRSPLANGTSVPVKRRWIWLPPGQAIVISEDGTHVDVPVGALWWKEFYIETDRGTFLIERRIIERVAVSSIHPEGWAFYTAHHLPVGWEESGMPIVLPSIGDAAQQYLFQPTDWLPTQRQSASIEIRFEDVRGQQYPYLFPGQVQCTACHSGAAGAYPNLTADPIFVFGFHPNNLTTESLRALIDRGWITGAEHLLSDDYPNASPSTIPPETASIDELTARVVAVLRNNCASCHNSSSYAQANFSAFIIDPNRNYTTEELVSVFRVNGRMVANAHPLVTPGNLEQSEIWLRLNGLDGRRRMPPREGGLPDLDPRLLDLLSAWIQQVDAG